VKQEDDGADGVAVKAGAMEAWEATCERQNANPTRPLKRRRLVS
jgi:hypothetical protein